MALWDKGLIALIKRNREKKPLEEEELEKNLCPKCNWNLKENSKGQKSCPICGVIYD